MKTVFLLSGLLLLTIPVAAQAPAKKKSKAPADPTITRSVIIGDSILSFEAGLVSESGDAITIDGATFYILDDSLPNILRTARLRLPLGYGDAHDAEDEDFLNAYAAAVKYAILDDYKKFLPAATAAIKPHIVRQVITGASGKASFGAVPAGNYYLMGTSYIPDGAYVIWNLKVDLKAGKNNIRLDQNNAVPMN